ncbi:methionyl-tRNA formyltransferase [Allokutzneria albata]|uniref:Methionyl-tRNA formyltransferase n=1 Tax=Allokutzneria albata TaxID=211114 RepID=A0A1G9WHJ6_ALLAB|nr:formyltransferase family protein [Allokutzneria albata]SDM84004.1 methionyl-tRNA formyltransferase [Allokutzneria albata]
MGLRVALVSFRADLFVSLQAGCRAAGHEIVLCAVGRSSRPGGRATAGIGAKVSDVVPVMPTGVDLLLPGDVDGLVNALRGYRVDVVVVCGFSWRVPTIALAAAGLGFINIHASLLPRYRGPAPVQWALRNGDPDIGLTAHWMDERIDTGNVIVQRGGIPLPEYVTFDGLWPMLGPEIERLVADALDRAASGSRGEPQDESQATYAGALEEAYSYIDWSRPARSVHNQVRTFYFGAGIAGPFAELDGRWVRVVRTRLEPGPGVRVQCADEPIWITEAEPAAPPR